MLTTSLQIEGILEGDDSNIVILMKSVMAKGVELRIRDRRTLDTRALMTVFSIEKDRHDFSNMINAAGGDPSDVVQIENYIRLIFTL